MSSHSTPNHVAREIRPERSFGGVARQISGWTTNLLATAIVLLGGLTLGWQVVGWWKETPPPSLAGQEAALAVVKLPALGDGREFWTRRGLLKIERITGSPSEATAAMRSFCRESGPAGVRTEAGKGEAEFVAQLVQQAPLEEAKNIAVYQPPGQTAMVVAVDRPTKRIVGWSFALPAEEGAWSLYHFRPAGGTATRLAASKAGHAP